MRTYGGVSQLSGPERFAVTITPAGKTDGESVEVCTWLHEPKAVAMAVDHYRRRHPDARIYDVRVQPLGRAARNDDGTASLTGR